MPTRASKKRPRDVNQLAKMIVDISTGEVADEAPPEPEKNQHAVALAALGASKGGQARRDKLSPRRRKQIAKKAAEARWGKREPKD